MITCPYCKENIEDTHWFYDRNLFEPNGEDQKEKCPHCKQNFMIRSYSTINWDVETTERYELFDGF